MKLSRLPSISPAIVALLAGAAWTTDSLACSSEPVMTGVCAMAAPSTNDFGNLYQYADGRSVQIQQYQAVYSLVGITYGGDARVNFNLPDLRGRVIVGAGTNSTSGITYQVGKNGGAAGATLAVAQLPAHNHALTPALSPIATSSGSLNLTTTLSGLTATTTMAGVTATAVMNGVPFSAPGSSLTLNASTGPSATNSPAAHTLGTTAQLIYSGGSPSVTMATGSIGGSVSGTIPATPALSAAVTFSGNPITTIGGSATTTLNGLPKFTLSGATQAAGQTTPTPMSTMLPFLPLNYFIATGPGSVYPNYD